MARLSLVATAAGLAATGALQAAVNSRLWRRPDFPVETSARVSVLVPVRNEAATISACLDAVLAQVGVDELEVIVFDDGSTDGTADIAAARADSRLRLVRGDGRVPAGWLGKPAACAELARRATGEFLVFVDADVVLAPGAVAAAVGLLVRHHLDLVSPYPRQLADGVLPRLIQPLLQWSFLTFVPLRLAEGSSNPSLAVANGQFLAVTRSAYDAAGGHAAVRNRVLDDMELLRAVQRAGGHGTVADGTALATCRMYASGRELADGYGKSLWCAFGSPARGFVVMGLLLFVYAVPGVAALSGRRWGFAGYAAAVAARVVAANASGGRVWPDAFAHPLSVVAFCGLFARSVWLHRRHRLMWKGRSLA